MFSGERALGVDAQAAMKAVQSLAEVSAAAGLVIFLIFVGQSHVELRRRPILRKGGFGIDAERGLIAVDGPAQIGARSPPGRFR